MRTTHSGPLASLFVETGTDTLPSANSQSHSSTKVFSGATFPLDGDLQSMRQTSPSTPEVIRRNATITPLNSPTSPTLRRWKLKKASWTAPSPASDTLSHGGSAPSSPILASMSSFPRLLRKMSNLSLGSPPAKTIRANKQIKAVNRNIEALFISIDSAVVFVQPEAEGDTNERLRTSWTERKAKVNINSLFFLIGVVAITSANSSFCVGQLQYSGHSIRLAIPRAYVQVSLDEDAALEADRNRCFSRWYLVGSARSLIQLFTSWKTEQVGDEYLFQSHTIDTATFPSGRTFQLEVVERAWSGEVTVLRIRTLD
jgi:hypothetical protein